MIEQKIDDRTGRELFHRRHADKSRSQSLGPLSVA